MYQEQYHAVSCFHKRGGNNIGHSVHMITKSQAESTVLLIYGGLCPAYYSVACVLRELWGEDILGVYNEMP